MASADRSLSHIDEHSVKIDASPRATWEALERLDA